MDLYQKDHLRNCILIVKMISIAFLNERDKVAQNG